MKNSLKKCLIILGALVIVALAACAFNSKVGFYAACGIIAILIVLVTLTEKKGAAMPVYRELHQIV